MVEERSQQILEHLRTYPDSWFTVFEISRKLGYHKSQRIFRLFETLHERGLADRREVASPQLRILWRYHDPDRAYRM